MEEQQAAGGPDDVVGTVLSERLHRGLSASFEPYLGFLASLGASLPPPSAPFLLLLLLVTECWVGRHHRVGGGADRGVEDNQAGWSMGVGVGWWRVGKHGGVHLGPQPDGVGHRGGPEAGVLHSKGYDRSHVHPAVLPPTHAAEAHLECHCKDPSY